MRWTPPYAEPDRKRIVEFPQQPWRRPVRCPSHQLTERWAFTAQQGLSAANRGSMLCRPKHAKLGSYGHQGPEVTIGPSSLYCLNHARTPPDYLGTQSRKWCAVHLCGERIIRQEQGVLPLSRGYVSDSKGHQWDALADVLHLFACSTGTRAELPGTFRLLSLWLPLVRPELHICTFESCHREAQVSIRPFSSGR